MVLTVLMLITAVLMYVRCQMVFRTIGTLRTYQKW